LVQRDLEAIDLVNGRRSAPQALFPPNVILPNNISLPIDEVGTCRILPALPQKLEGSGGSIEVALTMGHDCSVL
jgi:hypothetical protein